MAAIGSWPGGARRWLAGGALAVTLVVLLGCGRGLVPETGVIPDAAGSGSASSVPDLVRPSPVLPVAPGSRPTPTSPGSGTGATNSAFCRDLTEQLATLPNLLGQLGSADQRATVLQQVKAASAKLVRDAPPEVRADAQVLAGTTNRIIDDVAATPPNIDDVTKAFGDPAYLNASANIGRYASQHCGSLTSP